MLGLRLFGIDRLALDVEVIDHGVQRRGAGADHREVAVHLLAHLAGGARRCIGRIALGEGSAGRAERESKACCGQRGAAKGLAGRAVHGVDPVHQNMSGFLSIVLPASAARR